MRHPNKVALTEALLNYKNISKIKQERKGDKDTNGDPKRSKRKQRKVESNVEKVIIWTQKQIWITKWDKQK